MEMVAGEMGDPVTLKTSDPGSGDPWSNGSGNGGSVTLEMGDPGGW
jgi:hypothetical protein